jgi:hypothetical protein
MPNIGNDVANFVLGDFIHRYPIVVMHVFDYANILYGARHHPGFEPHLSRTKTTLVARVTAVQYNCDHEIHVVRGAPILHVQGGYGTYDSEWVPAETVRLPYPADFDPKYGEASKKIGGRESEFKPTVKYIEAIDSMLFLREDCFYRAEYVDEYLSLLWHPSEERVVGVQLHAWAFLYQQVQQITGIVESECPFGRVLATIPQVKISMDLDPTEEQYTSYEIAREATLGLSIPMEEMEKASRGLV